MENYVNSLVFKVEFNDLVCSNTKGLQHLPGHPELISTVFGKGH